MAGTPPQRWPENERRRLTRSDRVIATALVLADGKYAGAFVVENLSGGGALLIGDGRIEIGTQVTLLLQLDRAPLLPLVANVVRHHSDEAGVHFFAVAFSELQPAALETIQRAVLAAREQRREQPGDKLSDDAAGS
jgi:c-di-GMP-binding flagellar brake protein YcgR